MWCSVSRTLARSSPQSWFPRLSSRFSAAQNVYAPTTQVSALASPSSKASPKHTMELSPSPPGLLAGSASRCNYQPRHRTRADDDQGKPGVSVTYLAALGFASFVFVRLGGAGGLIFVLLLPTGGRSRLQPIAT